MSGQHALKVSPVLAKTLTTVPFPKQWCYKQLDSSLICVSVLVGVRDIRYASCSHLPQSSVNVFLTKNCYSDVLYFWSSSWLVRRGHLQVPNPHHTG